MAAAKTVHKKKRLADIVDLLVKGLTRKDIVQKIGKTYKVSASLIDQEIKAAKPKAEKILQEQENKRRSMLDAETEEAVKNGIVSDLELEMILCKVATGNLRVQEWVRGKPVLRDVSPLEIINAVDKLFKKRGSYPEIALRLKGSKEDPLMLQVVELTAKEVKELNKSLENDY